ncbi:MAG TPA: hypothetical protein VHS36_08775 [Candidatus Limnocylindrales bacterium]|nr:hypothetical protein [Candidatus Limnocylindrales bacterium]
MESRHRTTLVRLASLGAALALTMGSIGSATAASGGSHQTVAIKRLGTAHLSKAGGSKSATGTTSTEIQQDPEAGPDRQISGNKSYAHVPSTNVPRPATSAVVSAPSGFAGLDHFHNRFPDGASAAYAGNQFSLEPPDQALCIGGSTIIESVNTVVRVRDTSGAELTKAVPLNQFFSLAPEIVRSSPPVYGDFTSDPKCLYDSATGRFFLTILQLDIDPGTGNFTGGSHVYIAVSKSSDPIADGWYTFVVNTTNDGTGGTPNHAGCPCLGDQPLIGTDANGFYFTTNEFPVFTAGFNGAMVYAMSKSALESGAISAGQTQAIFQPTLAEGQAYSIQPATTPPGGATESANGGTEYFLSALDFNGATDNRIAVWKLTNTSSLATSADVHLASSIVATETYGQPPAVTQKPGSTPLIDYLRATKSANEHLSLLNSNDDRMNQVVFADGHLWGAVNTAVKSPTGPTRSAIAWFIVNPSGTPSLVRNGYVSVATDSVMFPAVSATAAGSGLMSFTLAGPNTYPSAAYVTLDATHGTSSVKVVKAGVGPADGFTGLVSFAGNGVERWGDYGASAVAADGTIWFAAESINQTCTLSEFVATNFRCGDTRTQLANWGSWIAGVKP